MECKKGSRFWRKDYEYSLGFWSEVAVNKWRYIFCSVAWIKEMNMLLQASLWVCWQEIVGIFFQWSKVRSLHREERCQSQRFEENKHFKK